jgi:hypothetical protein
MTSFSTESQVHLSMNKKTGSAITFVTTFMNIYEVPFQNKDVEWRFRYFRKLAETGIQLSVICSPDCSQYMEEITAEFPNVKTIKYMNLSETWAYQKCAEVESEFGGETIEMPNTRCVEKDTREYILLMNSKTEFLKIAVENNVWNSTHFAWIDFNIYYIFRDCEPYVLKYLSSLSNRTFAPYFLTLPGCWGKEHVYEHYLMNDICWRFCGGFFLGSADRVLEFHRCYEDYFVPFLREHKKLVWEVNFWAYLEMKHGLSVIWYPGDHNQQIIEMNVENMAIKLTDLPSCKHILYDYPDEGIYIPTSTAYVFYEGKHIINTRFVNYWLHPNGSYLIHDENGCLRTRNFCSVLNDGDLTPTGFKEMEVVTSSDETNENRFRCHGGNIFGLEDIRLYDFFGELRFVATSMNYSGVGKCRIVTGKYDMDLGVCSQCEVLLPPGTNDWYEKNWIPISAPLPEKTEEENESSTENQTEYFIYKWSPFEIGALVLDESGKKRLDIVSRLEHNTPMFSHVRGSTPFIKCAEGLLGVVHFSYEGGPRHYLHMLVLLDERTKLPLKYSEYFYFNEISIEFCIGFTILDGKYHFWISNFDRNPELMVLDIDEIPLLFDI